MSLQPHPPTSTPKGKGQQKDNNLNIKPLPLEGGVWGEVKEQECSVKTYLPY